jgi:aminoglycoside 6-adenylyltransferase
MLDQIIRPCILRLLAWHAADRHGWAVDTGKFGKWLDKFLPADLWQAYLASYAGPGTAETWDALFAALAVVRQAGQAVAESLGYAYPLEDDRRMLAYLQRVRSLPPDASSYDE